MQADPILMWVGSTQVGKSSAIKLLTGDQSIVCGQYGFGASTTYQMKIHSEKTHKLGKSYLHMDTIGLGDNRLKYDDNEIMNQIQIQILKKSDSLKIKEVPAIIATESFQADAYRLPQVFLQLRKMFNFFPSESIIVLATKRNTAQTRRLYERRQEQLKNLMRQYHTPENRYLEFDTPCEDADFPLDRIQDTQYSQLAALIKQCKPLKLDSIKKKQQMLKKRAEQIMKKLTKVEKFQFSTDKVTMRTETKTQQIDVPEIKPSRGFGGIIGALLGGPIGQQIGSLFDKPKKTTKKSEFSYQVEVPEIQQQKQTHHFENKPAFDYCYQLALEEFQKQSRSEMIAQK